MEKIVKSFNENGFTQAARAAHELAGICERVKGYFAKNDLQVTNEKVQEIATKGVLTFCEYMAELRKDEIEALPRVMQATAQKQIKEDASFDFMGLQWQKVAFPLGGYNIEVIKETPNGYEVDETLIKEHFTEYYTAAEMELYHKHDAAVAVLNELVKGTRGIQCDWWRLFDYNMQTNTFEVRNRGHYFYMLR